MFREELQQKIKKIVSNISPELNSIKFEVEYPSEPIFGDYTSNVAMIAGRVLNQNPRDLAGTIIEQLQAEEELAQSIQKIELAGPGFINFTLHQTKLWNESWGYIESQVHRDAPYSKQRIMVEFSSPNIAKPFNVGHLRSTIIGDSLARMYAYLGATVLKDNHLGDWGTQYGKLAYAVEHWGNWEAIEQNPIPELFKLYVKFHQEEESDPKLIEAGREYFKKLEHKDAAVTQTWRQLVDLSMQEFNRLYRELGVEFDMQLGESFYESMLAEVIAECKKAGVARESEGALLIFFDDDPVLKQTPLMIQKSNGTSTYGTRDLAGVKYRMGEFELDRLVIEIGNDQQHYFKQIIKASEMLGWVKPGQLVHVGHGILSLPTGKMSTRKGKTVDIQELISELKDRSLTILDTREGLDSVQKTNIAKDIAIGALKYNDLSQNRNSDIVFNREKSLSLDGNSAPYLQYIIARSNSILSAANLEHFDSNTLRSYLNNALTRDEALNQAERELLGFLLRFDDIVCEAIDNHTPSTLANYLFQVSQKYNYFYHTCPVVQSEDAVRDSRLYLVFLTSQLLKRGLGLLGINAPDKM